MEHTKFKALEKLSVDHPYYFSEINYYSNEASMSWKTMSDFFGLFLGCEY